MIEILNPSIITEDDVNGQYHAFGPSPASCSSCDFTCIGSSNSDTRPSGCSVCSTTCMGDCSGSCVGGCGDANCEGQCTLSCQSSCSLTCETTCRDTCQNGCRNGCVTSCDQTCTNTCSGSCQGCTGCSGSCTDACVNGCKYSCSDVATSSGTHTLLPDWPTGRLDPDLQKAYYNAIKKPEEERTDADKAVIETVNTQMKEWLGVTEIDPDKLIEILNTIKIYLDEVVKYDYKRISELDEAVVIHDTDHFVGQVTIEGQTIDVGNIDLEDLNLVVSDFDNKTVKITGASLAEFLKLNYKNYWVWTPYVVEDPETGSKTAIAWYFNTSFEPHPPEPINLADLITGGVGIVTETTDGLMPHELFTQLHGKTFVPFESLTGMHEDGSAAPAQTPLIRLAAGYNGNTDNINVFNTSLLDDLDTRYAPNGTFVTETELNTYKAEVALEFSDINNKFADYTTTTDLASTYLTQTDAATLYASNVALTSVSNLVNQHSSDINQLTVRFNSYYTITDADNVFVKKATAHTDIPVRDPANQRNGLMDYRDVANISSAYTMATEASADVSDLTILVNSFSDEIASKLTRTSYATTDYSTGDIVPGIVALPVTSNIKVENNGVIDTKEMKVPNLIKNSTFLDGFTTNWSTVISNVSQIDLDQSSISVDQNLNTYIAKLALIANGTISQQFFSDSNEGFTVGILCKRESVDKVIDVKIDDNAYVSHTIPAVTTTGVDEYYIAKLYFEALDSKYFSTHTIYIHNHDSLNAVSFMITNIMVQQGRKYTGWMPNEHDAHSSGSVRIISYDNSIAFKDLQEKYTSDVYDTDGVTLLHRAGELIDPSSSIIMHKNKQYLFFHITAQNQIDGPIRNDTIPLRIDLLTGNCDISGNAVTAGTLKDINDPSITLNVPVAQINSFFSGASTAFIKYLQSYQTTEFSKFVLDFRRIISSQSEVSLGTVPLVGTFDSNTNKNGEIFNDYENNSATGDYSHASGHGTIATADSSTVIGKYNVADGTGANDPKHLFIIGNGTADNDRSNIVEVDDDTFNVNGAITKNNNPIPEIVELTQAQYDALSNPDPDITYFITDYDASGGGGGSGGAPTKRTVLYDSGSYTQGAPIQTDIALADTLTNYDIIIIHLGTVADNTREQQYYDDTVTVDAQRALENNVVCHYGGYYQRWAAVKFTATTFRVIGHDAASEGSNYKPDVFKIIGYKFGSGGSSSGGGEPFDRTLLYDSGSYSSFAPYQQDVSLLDNLSNYDFIGVLITSTGDASANPRIMQNWFIDTNIALNEPKMSYCMYKERALHVAFTETTFNITFKSAVNETSIYYPEICKIYGYKMGSGGDSGGGTTPSNLGALAYKDTASGTAVTNVEYDETTHRITITLGTVTVS